MTHLSDEEIVDYSIDPELLGDRRAFAVAHLAECADCAATLGVVVGAERGFGEDETWLTADDQTNPRTSLASARAADIKMEDAAAARLLRRPLASPTRFAWWMARLIKRDQFRFAGVVRVLCNVAHAEIENNPVHARNIADVAIVISEALSPSRYSGNMRSELRGRAHKELANALRVLGRPQDALTALVRAETAYRDMTDPEVPIASVKYVRAHVLRELERSQQSLVLLREAAYTFLHHSEKERHREAIYSEAVIHAEQGERGRAEKIATDILSQAESSRKPLLWRARALQMLGAVHEARRHFRSSLQYATEAGLLFKKLGLDVEVLRTEWVCGLSIVGLGSVPSGIRQLKRVRIQFLEKEIISDAGLLTTELVGILRNSGEKREALAIATDLLVRLRKLDATKPALEAAAYLVTLAAADDVSAPFLAYVRRFFERIGVRPDLAFSPPT